MVFFIIIKWKEDIKVVVDKFKEIHKLAEELQIKYYKKEHECLNKSYSNIGIFEEYLDKQLKDYSNDSVILKDTIQKDNLIINTYLMRVKQVESNQLGENYNVVPLEEKNLYQYGAILTLPLEEGFIDINDAFSDTENEETNTKNNYINLKKYLTNSTEEEILIKVEEELKKELFL